MHILCCKGTTFCHFGKKNNTLFIFINFASSLPLHNNRAKTTFARLIPYVRVWLFPPRLYPTFVLLGRSTL